MAVDQFEVAGDLAEEIATQPPSCTARAVMRVEEAQLTPVVG
jgi:hypothetical protein